METEEPKKEKGKGKKTKKDKRKEGVWLEEAPGEVLDLMDSAVAQKVHTKAPTASAKPKGKKKRGEAFPVAEDGRLIIADSEDSGEEDEEGKLLGAATCRPTCTCSFLSSVFSIEK